MAMDSDQERVMKPDGNDNSAKAFSTDGAVTRARFEPADADGNGNSEQDLGWGIIRLFRDPHEMDPTKAMKSVEKQKSKITKSKSSIDVNYSSTQNDQRISIQDQDGADGTILCILAVPSYLTPSDFLGFVGEKTREEVSHFRMVRTERSNRYMVLMKFRDARVAGRWRKEWNGRAFDGMEPETCHVVYIKSVQYANHHQAPDSAFPDMSHDPFTPIVIPNPAEPLVAKTPIATKSSRPAPPPTPALIELPTCPVCLERMDESTGLLTILCQHVFHCSCLQKWRGSGCPVCRYTQDGVLSSGAGLLSSTEPTDKTHECTICHQDDNLWICLICGNIGCGRYESAHAFAHYDETGHCFAMDMATERVWDYKLDGYVHRILQESRLFKADILDTDASTGQEVIATDTIPASKLESLSHEYTALLTSQLDSQRSYYTNLLRDSTSKYHASTQASEHLTMTISRLESELSNLREMQHSTIPSLERDLARQSRRADKLTLLAHDMEKQWQEEKALGQGVRLRLNKMEVDLRGKEDQVKDLEGQVQELTDQTRDLMFMLDAGDRVKGIDGAEGGDVSVAVNAGAGAGADKRKKKSHGKGK